MQRDSLWQLDQRPVERRWGEDDWRHQRAQKERPWGTAGKERKSGGVQALCKRFFGNNSLQLTKSHFRPPLNGGLKDYEIDAQGTGSFARRLDPLIRFARALIYAHSFAGLLTHSLPSSWER